MAENKNKRVDIYTTKRLADRFCEDECWLDCNPEFYAQGLFGLGLTIRVKGKAGLADCPIANRKYPNPNYVPVEGSGDCGNTPTENPL